MFSCTRFGPSLAAGASLAFRRDFSSILRKIIAVIDAESHIKEGHEVLKGPRAVTMLRVPTTGKRWIDGEGGDFNVSASVVPCKEGLHNPTFHHGVGLLYDANDAREFLIRESKYASVLDLGDPDGLAMDVQMIRREHSDEEHSVRVDKLLLESKGSHNAGSHNEVVLSSRAFDNPRNVLLVKEHREACVEQLNLLLAGMLAAEKMKREGRSGSLGDQPIVFLPSDGPAVKRQYRVWEEQYVARTGIPMDRIFDVVKALPEDIELNFLLRSFEQARDGRIPSIFGEPPPA